MYKYIMAVNTKEQIIKTSYKLFMEKGYDNVSINDICNACNITKPTFYNWIGAKDELLSTFYNDLTGNISNKILELAKADNFYEQIWICFKSILEWSLHFGQDLYSQLFISNLKKNKQTFKLNNTLAETMTVLIKKAQQSGQILNKSNPQELYSSSVYLSIGYGVMWCINKGSFDLLSEFRSALENIYEINPEYKKSKKMYRDTPIK